MAESFFMPDFIMLGLIAFTIIVFLVNRTGLAKAGMITALIAFVISLFKVSAVIPFFFATFSSLGATVEYTGDDIRQNDKSQIVSSELTFHQTEIPGSPGTFYTHMTGTITNTTEDHIESFDYLPYGEDPTGKRCEFDRTEMLDLAPGASKTFQTDQMDTYVCENLTNPQVLIVQYDIDSLKDKDRDNDSYEITEMEQAENPTIKNIGQYLSGQEIAIQIAKPLETETFFKLIQADGTELSDCFTITPPEVVSPSIPIFEDSIESFSVKQVEQCS